MSFLSAAALLACSPANKGHAPPGAEGGRVEGVSTFDQLTSGEQTAYISDMQYIHGLAKPGKAVRLNLADPRQYRFAMARLKLANKTAKNSPYLFELIEARRQKHIASELKVGRFAEDGQAHALNGGGRTERHAIEVSSLKEVSPGQTRLFSTASSTFPDGSLATGLDVSVTTVNGNPLGPSAYVEEFENEDGNQNGVVGANVTINAVGNPHLTNIQRYAVSTYKWEDTAQYGFMDSYTYVEIGSSDPLGSVNPGLTFDFARIGEVMSEEPRGDVLPPNDLISVCINRGWTNDCDHIINNPPGSPPKLQLPLVGEARIHDAYKFDRDRIDDLKAALIAGPNVPEGELPWHPGYMRLVLTEDGGGCDPTGVYTHTDYKMLAFWTSVVVSSDGKTLSWNLTPEFDDYCVQVQDETKFTAFIPVPLKSDYPNQPEYDSAFTITSDSSVDEPNERLDKITMTNSCLAEGTQIKLGGGKLATVESLRIGQEIFNPHDGADQALTITDTAKGFEHAPMVRIRDAAGRTLLMTEMHPIATADRGMVQARSLRSGDVVLTEDGPSKLTEVSREPYNGKVYNLKVGSQAELASLGPDQTVVYANGFMVGDGQIQSKYESLIRKQERVRTPEQVPEQWRRDYLLSPHRK